MALDKQTLPVSFQQGIDTKTDPKQLQGKLDSLKNAIFQTGMEIRKRNGFSALAPLSKGLFVNPFQDELVSLDGTSLYSFDETDSAQVNKGTLVATSLGTNAVLRNNNQQTNQDSAINGTLKCFAFSDSTGGIRYSVLDSYTGQSIVNNALVDVSGVVPKVLAIGTKFVIVYSIAGAIKYRAISTSTPTSIGSATVIASDLSSSSAVYDATVINTSIFVAYNSSSARISLYSLSSSLVLSSRKDFGSDNPNVITVFTDASFNVWVAYGINGNPTVPNDTFIYAFILNNAMSVTVLAKTTVDDIASTTDGPALQNLTGIVTSTTATIYYEVNTTAITPGVPLNYIRQNTLTLAGVAGTASVFFKAAGLASKVFVYGSYYYILLSYQSNLQPSYFLVRSDAVGVMKISPSEAGGYTSSHILPEINTVSSGVFQTASLIKDSLTVQNGVIAAQNGVISAQITFSTSSPSRFTLGQNLHVDGGMVKMYDGASVVEHGFNVFPEGMYSTWQQNAPTYGGAVGFLTPPASVNKKQYCVVYEWTDNQGQLHESAPSIPISVDLNTLSTPTTITGNVVSGAGPTFGGNTITGASGGVANQYVTLIPSGAYVGNFISLTNQQIVSNVAGTLTLTPGWTRTPSGAGTFILSDYPLSLFQELAISGSLVVTGFTKNTSAQYGQIINAPPGLTSNYPVDTWYKSSAYSSVTGLFDTNNPPTGAGNTTLYYGTGSYAIPLKLPTLKFTDKQNVSLAVYATEVNGTVFFRTSSPTSLIYNDKTVDYVSFSDTTADNELIGNQELYTTGNVVENIGVPAIDVSTTFKSRAIAVPSENKLSWWYSKQVLPGLPVEFSDLFVSNIDSRIGKITATFTMDDKLIFWGPTSIFYVVGDGPTNTGDNNTFTDAQLISADVGCENQESIVLTPMGLMFKSAKGIYLLDRSLAVQYIGADVEAFNDIAITSAHLMNSVNQVRFTLATGNMLVFDYYYKQWDLFDGMTAIDSCLFQKEHTFIQSTGEIRQEAEGVFSDAGSVIPYYINSGWISFAKVQGFQRVYSFLFLADWKSAHTLTFNFYSNFDDDTIKQTITIDATTAIDPYEIRLFLNDQVAKSTALRIEIIESQSAPGEGLSISNMAFVVGAKRGLFKVPASGSYG